MIREIDFSGRTPDIIKLDKILPRTRGIILFYVNNKLKGQIIFNDKIRIWTLLSQASTTVYASGRTVQNLIDDLIGWRDHDRKSISLKFIKYNI